MNINYIAMTQNEKDLLIKDLCARLPYGVKVRDSEDNTVNVIGMRENCIIIPYTGITRAIRIDSCKPYLFPLSSMTEEQKDEFNTQSLKLQLQVIDDEIMYEKATEFEVDFYNKHHLDWRGLIPTGLAIDATNLNIY